MVQENNPSTLSKEELIKLLRGNIKAFNRYRESNGFEPIDLSDGKLQGATLTGAKLQDIDFSGANFEYANLVSADMSRCILKNALLIYSNVMQANLQNADLEGADLTGAQLEGAKLDGANLSMSLFSQANLTNVSLNQADLESTNFCSANLTATNFKNALNLKYCIFDKFTRWPGEEFLPKDFNPGKGMYGSDEDFSTTVVDHEEEPMHHHEDMHSQDAMTPDELRYKLMDEIKTSGGNLNEIEKKQILLDRKLDYVIASVRILTEKVVGISEAGGQGGEYGQDSYGFEGGTGGINVKLQELDDKIENVAGILTRFPVKSLEETYKLIDVIKRIEGTQAEIYKQLNQSVSEIAKANQEIQSILGGKLRASYISGLDKMFVDTIENIKATIAKSEENIIKQSSEMNFDFDETLIVKELEAQVTNSTNNLRQDLDRKLGTHGLFLKQMDEKLEKMKERTDMPALLAKFQDEVEYKLNQVMESTDTITESQREQINNLLLKLKVLDQKIDVMSETSTLSSVSNLIAEFGAGFSSELQMVKEAAIAIENRLKGLTGEVDLSTDFAIEAIAKSVNSHLADNIADAVAGSGGGFKELSDNLNHKIELLGKILDAKTNNLESRLEDVVKDASAKALSSSDMGVDLQDLRDISNSLANQIEELRNLGPEQSQIEHIKDDFISRIQEMLTQAKDITDEAEDSDEIKSKAQSLQEMSQKISEKLDTLYNNFDQRSDVIEEKVDEIAQSELEDLMSEFSQELEELRSSVSDLDSNTRDTIKFQGISSQEVINSLREDLTASVDEVLRSIKTMEDEGVLATGQHEKLNHIKDDISEKAELLKNVTDRISSRMENLFDTISRKTQQLEQKVDILAQAETDSTDIINDLLAEFESDLTGELKSLKDMLGEIESRLKDPAFSELTTEVLTRSVMDKLQDKVSSAVDKTNEALINKILGIAAPETGEKTIREEDYDDSIQGDIAYIKDIVTNIRDKMPEFTLETIQKIDKSTKTINDKLEELQFAIQTKTGSIETVMQEIVKEASSLPAASKTFDISNDIEHLKSIASTLDDQLKAVSTLEPPGKMSVKDLKDQIEMIQNQSKMLADEYGIHDIGDRVDNLKSISDKIALKIEDFAEQIGDNIDITEQLAEASNEETQELLEEFSAELDEIREFIQSTSNMTRDSIKAQSMVNEESISSLREDITAALDRMTSAMAGTEQGTFPFAPTFDSYKVNEQINAKQEMIKEVSAKISGKMESLLETIEKKTKTLEQKVDILAQSDTDAQDVMNEMLYDLKEEIITVFQQGHGDTKEKVINLAEELTEVHGKIDLIKIKVDETPKDQVSSIIKEAIEEVSIGDVIKQAMLETPESSYEAVLVKEISEIKEAVNNISGTLEASAPENIGDSIKEAIEDIQLLETLRDTIVESSGIEMAKEMSREVAEMNEKLTSMEEIIKAASQQEIVELVKDLEDKLSEKISSLKDITEDVNNNLIKLDETAADNIVNKLDNLIENGVSVDNDVLLDSMKLHLEEKLGEINIEEAFQGSVSDLTHKIEKLYEDVMDLTIALESKIDDLAEKDPSEDLVNISDNIKSLRDANDDISAKIEQLSTDLSVDAVTDMITDIETSIAREVEYLRNIGETINQGFTELEANIDIKKLEDNLDELIEFNSDVAAKLDKVLDATGNIDSDALLGSIKEHLEERLTELLDQDVGLEQILENLGSDLTDKLSHVIDHHQEIDTKLDILMEKDSEKHYENIMAEVHKLKTTAFNLEEKLDQIKEETSALNIEDQIEELQRDIKSKVELIADVVNTENIVSNVNESIEEFYNGIMEKTSQLQEKIEMLSRDELAEGIDNITTDISLLRNLTEDITEKVERIISNTEDIQTEEGMQRFRETIEEKLNSIIESDPSLNLENLLTSVGGSLTDKIDEYSETTRSYISDVLATLEENIISATESKEITDFVDNAEEKIQSLQTAIKEMTARIEVLQDMTENTLVAKTDIEDLFTNIDAITVSLNEKTDNVFDKIERQLDASGINNIKVLRRELEKRLETLAESTNAIRERMDVDFEGVFSEKVGVIGQGIYKRIEELSRQLEAETAKIDEKVEKFSSDDVISQIDGLVSDVLVELDKEVNRIGKITANIDKNVVTLDKNLKSVDKVAHDVDDKVVYLHEEVKKLPAAIVKEDPKSSSDGAIQSLVEYMQKDADQKLLLMKELIHSTALRGPGGELEQRLRALESHISNESKRHEDKLRSVVSSMKNLLDDIEGLKGISPLPADKD